jgi:hypothetical protein
LSVDETVVVTDVWTVRQRRPIRDKDDLERGTGGESGWRTENDACAAYLSKAKRQNRGQQNIAYVVFDGSTPFLIKTD